MAETFDPKDVTFLSDVIDRIQIKISSATMTVQRKVLPGTRGQIIKPLSEASTLLKAVDQVLDHSKMGTKLGFIKKPDGIQPVMASDGPKKSD